VGTHSPTAGDGKAGPKKEEEGEGTREASGGRRSGDGGGGGKPILKGKGKRGSRGNDMEKPGEAITTSKEREGVNGKEKGEEGGRVEGREMQAVLGKNGIGRGEERV